MLSRLTLRLALSYLASTDTLNDRRNDFTFTYEVMFLWALLLHSCWKLYWRIVETWFGVSILAIAVPIYISVLVEERKLNFSCVHLEALLRNSSKSVETRVSLRTDIFTPSTSEGSASSPLKP